MRWSIQQLKYLLAAAEQGRIRAGAAHVNVSQAAVSSAIDGLEDVFKLRIFQRRPGLGLTPTPSGQAFIARAKALVRESESFEEHAMQLSQQLAGTINVACFFPASPFILPKLITELSRLYPAISIALFEGDVYEIFQKLSEGTVEIALTYNLISNNNVKFESFLDVDLYAIIPKSHRLAHNETVSIFDLIQQPYILHDLPGSREWFVQVFRQHGLEPNIRFRTRSTEMLLNLVAIGQGYSLLGVRLLQGTTRLDDVCYLPIRENISKANFGLAYSGQIKQTRAVQVFADIARGVLSAL